MADNTAGSGLSLIVLAMAVFLGAAMALAPIGLLQAGAQDETFCLPGQSPHFSHGFAFLKSQLGDLMGEPLECEHYDAAGNAFQKTTTGQAHYVKETNTPSFTAGNRVWAWTPAGLVDRVSEGEYPAARATPQTVRVMSYNILFGAGVDPLWEARAARQRPFAYPGNRLVEILAVIKAARPDILGLQEAAGWDRGTPPVAQQVATELGMNYFLAQTETGLHLALFSRFEILETENLSDQIGNVGVLRATLLTPEQQPIHVFVVHLDPFAATTRAGEIAALTTAMASYQQARTILMGDTNMTCLNELAHCREYQLLSRAGWRLALAGDYMLDQIWNSPALAEPASEITFPAGLFAISDHYPVGAVIEFYP